MWTWGFVFYNQKNYCNWCTDVSCESEMSPTTESKVYEYFINFG